MREQISAELSAPVSLYSAPYGVSDGRYLVSVVFGRGELLAKEKEASAAAEEQGW
jgi:hypothetical protein